MAVAEPGHQNQLTEVYEMKNARTFLFVVLLGSIAATSPVLAADGAAANREVMPLAGYCHLKLPAIQARSLATDDPIPKDASSGDIIDYYGPCDKNAVEEGQVQRQRRDYNHNWILNQSDRF